MLMTVERRDEPFDERQRRTAQLHGLAEVRPLGRHGAGHVLLEPSGVGRAARHLAELLDLITGATQRAAPCHAPPCWGPEWALHMV